MYYNTTNETGEDLKESHKKAESQQEKILDIFKTSKEASPSQVMLALPVGTLITSVRRCITDWLKKDTLKKLQEKEKVSMADQNISGNFILYNLCTIIVRR